MPVRLLPALAVLLLAALAGGCGSGSSENARTLLKETFSGVHKVQSGVLSFSLSARPSGSSTLTEPITLGLSGPFQSRGSGKLPASDFTVSISAEGHRGQLSVLSTGTAGYVTMSGHSYQLPASSFQRLESSFSSVTASPSGGGSHGSGILSRLGIDPLKWVQHPVVVGTGTVGGAQTTHVRARIDASILLRNLSTFLQHASSAGIAGATKIPSGLSPATRRRIQSEVRAPRFDVWTGQQDKTARKLQVSLTLPVHGQLSTLLGGLRSAVLTLTLVYGDLNQPERIVAPTKLEPYSVFQQKLNALLGAVHTAVAGQTGTSSGALGSSGTSGSSGTGSTGSSPTATVGANPGYSSGGTGTSSGTSGTSAAYLRCVSKAGQDLAKLQKCAPLLNGGG